MRIWNLDFCDMYFLFANKSFMLCGGLLHSIDYFKNNVEKFISIYLNKLKVLGENGFDI